MEKRKTTLDREPVNSEYIRGKQNFDTVLKGYKSLKAPLWKSAWFYGPVGLAAITVVLSVTNLKEDKKAYEENTTPVELSAFHDVELSSTPVQVNKKDQKEVKEVKSEKPKPQVAPIVNKQEEVQETPEVEEPIAEETDDRDRLTEVVKEPRPEIRPVRRTTITTAEENTPKVYKNTLPKIAGIFTGSIKAYDFCTEEGITCNDGSKILAYKIQYFDGDNDVIEAVRGNQISEDLCYRVRRYNINQMIFITEIVAVDPAGTRKMIPSMSLIPTL